MPECWTLGKGDTRVKFSYELTNVGLKTGEPEYPLSTLSAMLSSLQQEYEGGWFLLDANRDEATEELEGMGRYFRKVLGRSNQEASRVAPALVDARCLAYDYEGKAVKLKVLRTDIEFPASHAAGSNPTVATIGS